MARHSTQQAKGQLGNLPLLLFSLHSTFTQLIVTSSEPENEKAFELLNKNSFDFQMLRFAYWCLLLILICKTAASHTESAGIQSYQKGDRFVYDLYWSFIKVGEAELSFAWSTDKNPPADHLLASFTVKTSGIADRLFKVRDHIESWIDPSTGLPSYYKKKQREGKLKRDVTIQFDWTKRTAVYTKDDKVYDPIPLDRHAYDPLSLITEIARNDYERNKKTEHIATDGKKLVQIQTSLRTCEAIDLRAGKFDAYHIEVATNQLEGVFKKSPNASIEIWLNQDNPAIPLKMKSEVVVGKFHGELRGGVYMGVPFGRNID